MAGLKLITSNRLEKLIEDLAEVIRVPLRSALQPEIIMVQSQGMARWLKLQLAQIHGICSNYQFPFPRAFSYSVFRAALPALPADPVYDPDVLVWRIMKELPMLVEEAGFGELKNYLWSVTEVTMTRPHANPPDQPGRLTPSAEERGFARTGEEVVHGVKARTNVLGNSFPEKGEPRRERTGNFITRGAVVLDEDLPDKRKLFQLARKIAYLYDQYVVFRPELILRWEKGEEDHWQAKLWREIKTLFDQHHPAVLQAQFLEKLAQPDAQLPGLPGRIAVFGISALPPFYLRTLAALSRHLQVNLFLLQPCREYWGYISSGREKERILKRHAKGAAVAGELHLETGNRLLGSMGQLGRDFLNLIYEAGDWQDTEIIVEPGEENLLPAIQSDILFLRDRGKGEAKKKTITEDDTSVQVHSCHSPLREMEVLYDHLLDWFQSDPTLTPRDILVMMPDVELYAPFIQGVFDTPEQDRLRIPFSLADRGTRTQSHLVETFLSILNLAGSRLGVSRVLALIESASLRRKFGIVETDLDIIRRWVEEVRIRWGKDQEQRVEFDVPGWPENTWRHGLDRLLLGYAMTGGSEQLFHEILPYDDLEGNASDVLGQFVEFAERLFATLKSLESPRQLTEWAEILQTILNDFFEPGEDSEIEVQVLRACFEKLARTGECSGFDGEVELSVLLEQLNQDLSEDRFGAGYLTGGITFCGLKPMRSIPAKIICLVGMNDRAFPRSSSRLSFDLMAQSPRQGDRSSREDDRYLFLETILSARERLYISYLGQSIKDNSESPPSVLVSELMDYIEQGFEMPGKEKDLVIGHVLTRHRLHAFSNAYFNGGRLFSYSRQNLGASQAIQPTRSVPAPFVPVPIAEPEPEWRKLTMKTLEEFFCHPAKFLASRRLGLRLQAKETVLEEREPFAIDGLEGYALKQELLDRLLSKHPLSEGRPVIRASGRLPAGIAGNACYASLSREVEAFVKRLESHLSRGFEPPTSFELAFGGFRVSGHFDRVTRDGLLFYRCATIKPKDLVRAWIKHLLWNSVNRNGRPPTTIVLGTESIWRFAAVEKPETTIEMLLRLYWTGLSQPLKFFPDTSFAFAKAEFKARNGKTGKGRKQPFDHAAEKWRGSEFAAPGECKDEYFSLFFRNADALDEDFENQARAVFTPLLECGVETESDLL